MTSQRSRPAAAHDPRARLIVICHAFPEVTSEGDQHVRFQVRNKTFAYYLDDHHGDGRAALCCKAAPGAQAALIASDPARFYLPAYLGPKGWIALRLDLDDVDWDEVAELAFDAYRLTAPKRLLTALLDQPAESPLNLPSMGCGMRKVQGPSRQRRPERRTITLV